MRLEREAADRVANDSDEDIGSNPSTERAIGEIVARRLSRRAALKGIAAAGVAAGLGTLISDLLAGTAAAAGSTLGFAEVPHGPTPDHQVAAGYDARTLIRWGDPVEADAPEWTPATQSAAAQARQFGYNNDFVAFLPLPLGSGNSENGLLVVNHEYTELHMMFSGMHAEDSAKQASRDMVDIELNAHGMSVVEVRRTNGRWDVVKESRFNRRTTLASTPVAFSGSAAGHDRMKTSADPTGRACIGTINNCSGGVTPWGTVLTAEENFHQYFTGDPAKTPEAANHARYGLRGRSPYGWGRFHDRFDVTKEPNEPNRFGWIVEIDPYDPRATPVKRTSLGRFKHEAATCVVNPNGTVTVYSGDDERGDYLYKFVTRRAFNPGDRQANRDLLDDGTLYVARFNEDGTINWLPLVFGTGTLTAENGFASQADILIETRRAADLLKATPMDRPEDVETNPVSGRTYVVLTNNADRKPEKTDRANPRPANLYGHILELIPPGEGRNADHGALEHRWEVFLLAGDPAQPSHGARYGQGLSASGWLACPDNLAFDSLGRIWIASDQGTAQSKNGIGDGLWAADTAGPGRAVTRFFYRCPTGAEMCGPAFTPDNRTLFLAVQHPAADDPGSSFAKPTTRWPDFKDDVPPRPSVVVITKRDGGVIGS
jgi:secreted PhoX family phosphatase